MKIAFYEIKPEEEKFFKQNLQNHDLYFFDKTVNEYSDVNDFEIISVFVHSKVNKEVLDRYPKLKYIQTRSTGYEHLDLDEIYKRNITASNVRGYAGPAVGEFAFSLLLEALRKTYVAIARLKNGSLYYSDLKGSETAGKKIGILGLGTIGSHIAKLAVGFGASVSAFNRSKKVMPGVKVTQNLDEVLSNSDYLFIALPLTKSTKNLINCKNIKTFKGSVIVNPARAEIIEQKVYETFEGIIAADVLPEWGLAKKDNIIATPHMAYYTVEALYRIMKISLDNITDFISGKNPRDCLKQSYQKENR
jgi:D-lactate dehydrogenase